MEMGYGLQSVILVQLELIFFQVQTELIGQIVTVLQQVLLDL